MDRNSCSAAHSVCSRGICSCELSFTDQSGICCESACHIVLIFCDFPLNYIVWSLLILLTAKPGFLLSSCMPGGQCSNVNTSCSNGICQCQSNFFLQEDSCRELHDWYSFHFIPSIGVSSIPSIGVFIHFFNHFPTERRVPLGGACSIDDFCADNNAECSQGRCTCLLTYYNHAGTCGESCIVRSIFKLKYIILWIIMMYPHGIPFSPKRLALRTMSADWSAIWWMHWQ